MFALTRRPPRTPLGARLGRAIAEEEERGRSFAFRARLVAVVVVMLWLVLVIEPQRQLYYLAVTGAFLLLGLVPHLLRRQRHAVAVRFAFIILDVALVTAVVILPPPGHIDFGFPIQMRVRGPEFLYLNLLIVGAALSYSPLQVIWTGLWSVLVWSAGVVAVWMRADTLHYMPPENVTAAELLPVLTSPYHVGLFTLLNQIVLTLIATALLAAAVWRARALLLRQTRDELARAALARYVSPDVAEGILSSEQDFGAPTNRKVALLFADIVGFTGQSERMAPDRVVRFLKSFHARSSAVVFRHGGTLDKYLGDGFLATFGTLHEQPDAAARAIRCAIDLQDEIERWNAKRARRGAAPVQLSVGVHYGPVVVGNIGGELRMEFTVVGDAVNLASRLETITRQLGCKVAVSDAALTEARLHDATLPRFESAGDRRLDGREQTVSVQVWPPRD